MPQSGDSHDENAALRVKLDALAEKIRAHRPPPPPSGPESGQGGDGFGSAMSQGLRAGSEFVTAIVVGAILGFGLDWLVNTKPAFTIVFFLLGVAAGTVNVIRATAPKGETAPHNSRLSEAEARDKDEPRGGPGGAQQTRDSRRGG